MIELAFIQKLPGFILRQLIRHRTLDKTGFLGAYIPGDETYMPPLTQLRRQSDSNKQGRGTELEDELKVESFLTLRDGYRRTNDLSREAEASGADFDVMRQLRGVGSYTHWCFSLDLKNLNHLLGLRLDKHAQVEAQEFAKPVATAVKAVAPISFEAFEDYHLHSQRHSRLEVAALGKMMQGMAEEEAIAAAGLKGGEINEFKAKLDRLRSQ
jgi:thymidylate synthase (FAD)